jgi:AcrR family transcriptional regulator
LAAAREVLREQGYAALTFSAVAAQARTTPESVEVAFGTRDRLFNDLLRAYSPLADLEAALDSVQGETADELLRDAMRRMVAVADKHADILELAVLDAQVNNGTFLASISAAIFPKAKGLLNRIETLGGLRPVSDAVIGRAFVALWIGFIVSERALPGIARLIARLLPQKAWLDGMMDLLLYGVLEDDAR